MIGSTIMDSDNLIIFKAKEEQTEATGGKGQNTLEKRRVNGCGIRRYRSGTIPKVRRQSPCQKREKRKFCVKKSSIVVWFWGDFSCNQG